MQAVDLANWQPLALASLAMLSAGGASSIDQPVGYPAPMAICPCSCRVRV